MMAKVWVEAYGCSASYADSEMISGLLSNGGHTLAASPNEADASILVTCSVKDSTAGRMRHRIRELDCKPLLVAGCLAKAEPQTVKSLAPKASLMGPASISNTVNLLEGALAGRRQVKLEDDTVKVGIPKVRINPTVGIVEIASGCMSECTFCQTKLAKGGISSYRIGDIVRQVGEEVDSGCSEIWLSSTDNGCYGLDIGSDLAELVDAVCTIPGEFTVRVGMMNPMYMPRMRERLFNSYKSSKVYDFIHIPVQSGSNQVLALMARGHTIETFERAVYDARAQSEMFTVSTDVIVGHPGETDADFGRTLSLLERTRPDIVNISKYSARPGTVSAKMAQVSSDIISARSRIITETVSRISAESNRRWVGSTQSVLFTEKTDRGVRGRNYAYKPIYVQEGAQVGQRHMVNITASTTNSLIGQIAG